MRSGPILGTVDFPASALQAPSAVASPGGAVVLAADARLDNRDELVDLLAADRDASDAELILAAYLLWGEDCPQRLLGDFAVFAWDLRHRRLFAFRDPLGMRPLCYARTGSRFHVASEARQVLGCPGVPRDLDELTVADYLAGCAAEPGRTFFHAVRRLPPGHRLVAGPDGERVERWWEPDTGARTRHPRAEDYAAHFLETFRRAVADRVRDAEGTAGVLLSGGLDSGAVAAVARQILPRTGGSLFAGSFVFESLRECDESDAIRAVTGHLGIEADLFPAERHPLLGGDVGEDCRPCLETPFVGWEASMQDLLRRAVSRGARVLLTGHGGDDLLTGTPLAYADRLRRGDLRAFAEVVHHAAGRGRSWRWVLYHYLARPFLPASADRMLRRMRGRSRSSGIPEWIEPAFARRTGLAGRTEEPPLPRSRDSARQALAEHFRQAPWDPVVHWYSRTLAPFGIEARHPFLDRRLAELLISFPPERIFRAGPRKPLLRQAMAGLLPDEVRLLPQKTRLGAFLDLSVRTRRSWIEALLHRPLAGEAGFVDTGRLREACRLYLDGSPGEEQRTLWYALTLEAWLREHGAFLGFHLEPALSRPAA